MSTLTYPVGVKRLQGGGFAGDMFFKGANYTLTREDSGRVLLCTVANLVITLPATEPGLIYTVGVTAAGLSAGTGLSVSPAAVDKLMGNGFTSLDNKDAINTGATDTEGDMICLIADGVDGWYFQYVRGTWAREA
jgi:hypothetical protein